MNLSAGVMESLSTALHIRSSALTLNTGRPNYVFNQCSEAASVDKAPGWGGLILIFFTFSKRVPVPPEICYIPFKNNAKS
jgi:hypothetical protein